MEIVYIYDLKARNKKQYNRLKRRFYYKLNKLDLSGCVWKTKSVLFTEPKKEKMLDVFFTSFGRNIEVYKLHAELVEELNERAAKYTRK